MDIGAWLKKDFGDSAAGDRLRFDVLDVIHHRGQEALDDRNDARVHLLRRDNTSALRELRRGLAIDSSNAPARALAQQLGRSGTP